MKKIESPVRVGFKWIDVKGREWEVFEKLPFGQYVVRTTNLSRVGQMSRKDIEAELARMKRNPYSKKSRYRHSRLKSKSRFDKRSFRTIKIGKHGRLLRVGCPKGRWKRGRCSVGMRAQGVLTPKKYAKLLRITRARSSRRIAANGRRPKVRRKSWAA